MDAVALAATVALMPLAGQAQTAPWQVVQSTDGTLYLLKDGARYTLLPDAISDDDLAALPDGGLIGGTLALPSPQTIVVQAPAPSAPAAAPLPPEPAPVAAPVVVAAPAPAPQPAEQAVKISGSGDVSTKPFTLRGGNYTISWTATSTSTYGGMFGATVKAADPSDYHWATVGPVNLGPKQTLTGQTNAYNLKGGQYYVQAYTTADWSVTITPQ